MTDDCLGHYSRGGFVGGYTGRSDAFLADDEHLMAKRGNWLVCIRSDDRHACDAPSMHSEELRRKLPPDTAEPREGPLCAAHGALEVNATTEIYDDEEF